MNYVEVTTPHPACILLSTHPLRHIELDKTDISRTFAMHTPMHTPTLYGDDYDRVQRDDWLDRGFKQ